MQTNLVFELTRSAVVGVLAGIGTGSICTGLAAAMLSYQISANKAYTIKGTRIVLESLGKK